VWGLNPRSSRYERVAFTSLANTPKPLKTVYLIINQLK
jgi:hypothetical protein